VRDGLEGGQISNAEGEELHFTVPAKTPLVVCGSSRRAWQALTGPPAGRLKQMTGRH
jgi:hypothetical protein